MVSVLWHGLITIRSIIYTLISGLWHFNSAYETYIDQYNLNSTGAVIVFLALGTLFALLYYCCGQGMRVHEGS